MDLNNQDKVALWIDTYLSLETAVKTDLPILREKCASASGIFDPSQSEKDRFEELLDISAEIQKLHAQIAEPLRTIEHSAPIARMTQSNHQIREMFGHFEGLAELIIHQGDSFSAAEKAKYFQPYRSALGRLSAVESMTQIITLLHEYDEEDLATIFARFMLACPIEEPPAFIPAGVVDWVTAHRVLLRLRHLSLRLDRSASLALKEDRDKMPWFHQPELSFLAQKVESVVNHLLVNFKEYFIRAAPSPPVQSAPAPAPEPSKTVKEKEPRDPQNEGGDIVGEQDSSSAQNDPAPPAAVNIEKQETPMEVDEPKQRGTAEEERIMELQSRWSRRMDQFARRFPIPDHDLVRLANAVTHIYQYTQIAYADEDITEDPTYMEPDQIVQAYFRNVILRFCTPKLVEVRGDGNCFFRAIIKSLWPSVTQFYEDLMSSRLRNLLNPASASSLPASQQPVDEDEPAAASKPSPSATANDEEAMQLSISDPYKGFIIPSVNDPTTMATPGVWADHLQVKKASDYFNRPLWLLRYDDVNLTFDPTERAFVPGPDYRITAPENEAAVPITLYFIPEMHYEVILKNKSEWDRAKELNLDSALKSCCKDGPGPALFKLIESQQQELMDPTDVFTFAEQICHVAFALDKAADLVEERFEMTRSAAYDVKVAVQNEIQQLSETVKKSLLLIKSIATAIRTPRFVECLVSNSPAGALLDHVLVSLSLDEIHIETTVKQEFVIRNVESKQIRPGAGPLSAVFNRVQWCRSAMSSYNVTILGMRENKQKQERSLRDTLRKIPSSGILGAEPASPKSDELQLAASAMQSLGEVFKLGETKSSFSVPFLTSNPTPSSTARSYAGSSSSSYGSHTNGFSDPAAKRRKINIDDIKSQTALDPIVVKVNTAITEVPLAKSSIRGAKASALCASSPLCTESNWLELFGSANYWILDDLVLHPEAMKALFKAAAHSSDSVEGIFFEKCMLDPQCLEVLITDGYRLSSKIKIKLDECRIAATNSKTVKDLTPNIEYKHNCTWNVGDSSAISASKFYSK